MKLKKLEFKQILKLHLLKHKTYDRFFAKNNDANLITNSTLNETLFNLKKALQITFQYHKQSRQILFVGVPKKLKEKINKTTNHIAVAQTINIQGLVSNNSNEKLANVKQINKQNMLEFKALSPKLLKKPDLIVIIKSEKAYAIEKECVVARLPFISLTSFGLPKEANPSYQCNFQSTSGNSNLVFDKNLFLSGLDFIFKVSKTRHKKSFHFK